MALAALFDGGSAASPAILAPGRSPLNYANLRRELTRTADALRRHGIRRGSRVALVLPDGPDLAVCFFGVAAVAACAPLNPGYREAEFAFYLEDLEPAAVIVPAGYDSPVRAVAARLRIPIGELSPDLTGHAGSFELQFDGSPIACGTNCGDAAADDIALVLHTSGTTSRPKMVPLTHRNLCASAGNIARTLLLTAADRGLVVMPLFHIHGLVAGVLAPLSVGGSIVCTSGFVATQFFDSIDAFAPTWYTAVPAMHRAIVSRARDHADVLARRQLRFIRASSAPLPPTLMAELEAEFRAPVIEAYGMTEAAHQIASNPLPPEPRKPGSVGRPAGVEIGILNEQGVHFSASNQPQDGEVVIRGASITVGYSGPHDTNIDAFHDGWFRTGDLGRFDTDGYLFLRGRSKEIINRGGEKISPREIDEVLQDHPAVDAAVTFPIPDTVLGEDIGVAVVVRRGAALAEEDLLAFASTRLADFKIPRRIVFLQDLPKGPTGKVQRRGLAHSLGIDGTAVAAQPQSYVEPRSDTERKLAAIWQDVLRVPRVGRDDAFLDLGGDSRLATQIIVDVVATFGVTLPVYELFSAATLGRVADAIERLPRAKEAALAPMVVASRERALALSFGQERIWFLTRFEAAGAAYHHLIAIRLRGRLSVDALRDSIQAVVDRHEVLRTVYVVGDGFLPLQSVARDSILQFTVERQLDLPHDRRDALAPAIASEPVRQPIDLSRELPLRARIVEFAPDDHLLVVLVHHIAFDGWSESIFTRELSAAYAARLSGTPLTLPPLPIQYGDFAQWHRQQCGSGPRAAEHLRYWNARLRGAPSLLALPTDYPRPAERRFAGRVTRVDVPQAIAADLRRLARSESATLYMVLLAAFQWLLAERSGQTDILVGTPVAGRTHADVEPLIGFFVNTLVMRADLSTAETFRQLLRQVRDSTLDAIAHQETPFERVIEALAPPRTLSFTPVFQVLFQLRNIPEPTIALADVEAQLLRPDPGTAQFDLSLDVVENEHGLECVLTFDTALFAEATAALLLADYRRTLEAIAANVDAPIGKRCDGATVDAETLTSIVEAQVARTPAATAIVVGPDAVTYADLNTRANRLAHYLKSMGVGPEALVGVFLERSADMVTAMLAILKAGGAYVPLDPAYPRDRISAIVEDSCAGIVITTDALVDRLPPVAGRTVSLDAIATVLDMQPGDNPLMAARPATLAYVLFTSGSTGRPKGVAIEHLSAAAFVHWAHTVYSSADLAGVLFSTSVCFDLSIFEIFVTLGAGGAIVLAPTAMHLPTLPARDRVTLVNTVPSIMSELVRIGGVPDSVTVINLAGETLHDALVEQIYTTTRARIVCNLYGPTEATTYSTFTAVARGQRVTIGRPIDGTCVYVLDEQRERVADGAIGEIYIAGAGVARGYIGRPDLTAERFFPDPLAASKGARMYRTGDLGRRNADGTFEYLGRVDQQVKIRGLRIELGEIEAILARHAAVAECAVAVRGEGAAARLVAYVQSSTAATDPDDFRAHLARTVPDYMVPAAFVMMNRLPRTPNGKIDRQRLPAPPQAAGASGLGAPFDAPVSDMEKVLAAMWREILGVDAVGRRDNFFDLGGTSLRVLQVLARVQDAHGAAVSARAFFLDPTVAGLVRAIDAADDESRPLTPIERGQGTRRMSFAQERLWILNRFAPDSPVYNVADVVRFRGPCPSTAVESALARLTLRHPSLRTTFRMIGDRPMQHVLAAADVPLTTVDLRGRSSTEQQQAWTDVGTREVRRTFDLARAPLMRATLFHFSDSDHALLLVLHHIITDEWSQWILRRDLHEFVAASIEGRACELPQADIAYADFAEWQRDQLRDDVREPLVAYWRRTLAGAPTHVDLPKDFTRPVAQQFHGATERFAIPAERWAPLRAVGREERATPFMTLAAIFMAWLHRLTGQSDILVGTPIAMRTHAATEAVVGLFQNTVVLRARFDQPNATVRRLIRDVRETALGAIGHAELPFQQIVAAAAAERHLGRTPLFQVMFILHETDGPRSGGEPPLALLDTGTSKMDLSLSFVEANGGLLGTVEYDKDLFRSDTVRRWLQDFINLIDICGREPDQVLMSASNVSELGAAASTDAHRAPAGPRPARAASRSAIESDLDVIWREVLGRPHVAGHDDFFLIGGDSLAAARMFALVESRLGVTLPLSALLEHPTIVKLAGVIAAKGQPSAGIWPALHTLTEAPGVPFYVVHTIGGDVLNLKELAAAIGPDQSIVGIQAILDERVGDIYETIEATARAYVAEVRNRQPTGPYYLAGMSSGATVALEMAQQFHAEGDEVAMLAVIDGAPSNSGYDLRRIDLRTLVRLARNLPNWVRDDLLISTPADVYWRARQKLSAALRRIVSVVAGGRGRHVPTIRDVVNLPRRGVHWEIFLAKHDRALRRYIPRRYDGRVTVFKARTHPLLWTNDCERVWQRLSTDVQVHEVPGTHLSMVHEPHVAVLASKIRATIRAGSAANC